MTPAEPASLMECHASSGEDDSPDEARASPETAASTAEAGDGDPDAGPYVGQRFPTHDAAYEFYSGFARRRGFSIRRHRTEGKDGVGRGLTRRYFVCHRAGSAPAKPLAGAPRPQRNRSSSRCGCPAYMRIGRGEGAGAPPEWRVTGFSDHHNHALLGQEKVRLLPAYRVISGADRDRILMFARAGISVQQMMRLMELEKSVEPGNLPFTEKDVRNLIQSLRKADQEDDESVDLLRLCKDFREKDPSFKFEFTKDVNNRLQNIAWTYGALIQSYEMFGDTVVFDTTHRLSALDMALGIWVGLNNYGMPSFFACVLLREVNQESLSWALQVFLNFMNRKAPQMILTDQNMYLNEAIEQELPSTKHALCIWLQDELVMAAQYTSFHLEESIFLVRHHTETAGGCSVTWNQRKEHISCSCQLFESSGILCRHALCVLLALNYFQIPDLYLPVRWRRIQPPPPIPKCLNGAPLPKGVASERVVALQSMVTTLVSEAAKSNERMDLATHEVSVLLSRIKQQPVSMHGSDETARRLQ
ncbi:unnamed protein product [Urochloa humidicola]